MTEEVCARPGCGHNRRQVNYTIGGPPGPEDFGHHLDGCHVLTETPEGWMRCPCLSYRTQAQQELADDVARHLGNLDDYGTEDLAALLRRTQELYP